MSGLPNAINVPARAIEAAGKALWGEHWQTPMAQALRIELRRVQRYAAAAKLDQTYPLSRGIVEDLVRELERKHLPLQRAYEDLLAIYDGD